MNLDLFRQKLLKQGYVAPKMKSWLQKLYGRHNDRISQMGMDALLFTYNFIFPLSLPGVLPDLTVCMRNTADVL